MTKKITKKYSNNDITVVWRPELCIHSTNCWKALLPVFDPTRRPWVDMAAAGTEEIVRTVNNCPSQALSYYNNDLKQTK